MFDPVYVYCLYTIVTIVESGTTNSHTQCVPYTISNMITYNIEYSIFPYIITNGRQPTTEKKRERKRASDGIKWLCLQSVYVLSGSIFWNNARYVLLIEQTKPFAVPNIDSLVPWFSYLNILPFIRCTHTRVSHSRRTTSITFENDLIGPIETAHYIVWYGKLEKYEQWMVLLCLYSVYRHMYLCCYGMAKIDFCLTAIWQLITNNNTKTIEGNYADISRSCVLLLCVSFTFFFSLSSLSNVLCIRR